MDKNLSLHTDQRKAEVAILFSGKAEFKVKSIVQNKDKTTMNFICQIIVSVFKKQKLKN